MNRPREMLKSLPTKESGNNVRKRHLTKDDNYSLEVNLAQEAANIIKIKVEHDAINLELKHKIKHLENVKEVQQKDLYQQSSQYEKLDGVYRNELKMREDVLNKINSSRLVQKTLETHSLALRTIINGCQQDRQKLSESYKQAIEMLQKMKDNHVETAEQQRLTIESLQAQLAAEKQLRLDSTSNWERRNTNMDEFIDHMKKRFICQEDTIKSLKIKDDTNSSLLIKHQKVSEELSKEMKKLKEINEQYIQRIFILEEDIKGKKEIILDKEKLSISALQKNDVIKEKLQELQTSYNSLEVEKQNYIEELLKKSMFYEKELNDLREEINKKTICMEEFQQKSSSLEKELYDYNEYTKKDHLNWENDKLKLETELKSLQQSFDKENLVKDEFEKELNAFKTIYDDEDVVKQNDGLKQEVEEKSSGLTSIMMKYKALMETDAKYEKAIEEYKKNNEEKRPRRSRNTTGSTSPLHHIKPVETFTKLLSKNCYLFPTDETAQKTTPDAKFSKPNAVTKKFFKTNLKNI
ncbi:uncharacterized protein LOC143915863 [Arctopsyche grandis]|uniref:uncharacterized protein LOC143915863 n=1 Tax=Arctopsyche grandis TaxID=121162 RepID=UPI00406D8CA8